MLFKTGLLQKGKEGRKRHDRRGNRLIPLPSVTFSTTYKGGKGGKKECPSTSGTVTPGKKSLNGPVTAVPYLHRPRRSGSPPGRHRPRPGDQERPEEGKKKNSGRALPSCLGDPRQKGEGGKKPRGRFLEPGRWVPSGSPESAEEKLTAHPLTTTEEKKTTPGLLVLSHPLVALTGRKGKEKKTPGMVFGARLLRPSGNEKKKESQALRVASPKCVTAARGGALTANRPTATVPREKEPPAAGLPLYARFFHLSEKP